jgi:hypothetical protein
MRIVQSEMTGWRGTFSTVSHRAAHGGFQTVFLALGLEPDTVLVNQLRLLAISIEASL